VARQYRGQLVKQDNCQIAVRLSIATQRGSLPIAWQLYVPKGWIEDRNVPIGRTFPTIWSS